MPKPTDENEIKKLKAEVKTLKAENKNLKSQVVRLTQELAASRPTPNADTTISKKRRLEEERILENSEAEAQARAYAEIHGTGQIIKKIPFIKVQHVPREQWFHFTEDHDKRILEAYDMYGNKWKKIAAHVGDGVTNLQVCARYRIICPQHLAAVEEYEWTPEKDLQLAIAVGKWGNQWTKGRWGIKWVEVARELGGGVTKEVCRRRWVKAVDPDTVAKRKKTLWTSERLMKFTAAVALFQRDWEKVAEFVGDVTAVNCAAHWKDIKNPAPANNNNNKKRTPWKKHEIEKLVRLVQALPLANKRRKRVNWTEIAEELGNKSAFECRRKWEVERMARKKSAQEQLGACTSTSSSAGFDGNFDDDDCVDEDVGVEVEVEVEDDMMDNVGGEVEADVDEVASYEDDCASSCGKDKDEKSDAAGVDDDDVGMYNNDDRNNDPPTSYGSEETNTNNNNNNEERVASSVEKEGGGTK